MLQHSLERENKKVIDPENIQAEHNVNDPFNPDPAISDIYIIVVIFLFKFI